MTNGKVHRKGSNALLKALEEGVHHGEVALGSEAEATVVGENLQDLADKHECPACLLRGDLADDAVRDWIKDNWAKELEEQKTAHH